MRRESMTVEYEDTDNNKIIPQIVDDAQAATTQDIPDSMPNIEQPIGAEKGSLLVMLPGQSSPLTFVGQTSIVFGRYDPATGLSPTVDLTPYFGKSLGVSRRHAEIFLHEGRYFVRDLDSANGTLLNNKKVTNQPQPIRSGDQLHLGELLLIVFMSDKEPTNPSKKQLPIGLQRLYLRHHHLVEKLATEGMTVGFLGNSVLSYLNSLNDIQATILAANQQPDQPLTINGIYITNQPNTIEIQVQIHQELLIYLRDTIQKLISQIPTTVDESLSLMMYRRCALALLENLTSIEEDDVHFNLYIDRLENDLQKLFDSHLQIVNLDA